MKDKDISCQEKLPSPVWFAAGFLPHYHLSKSFWRRRVKAGSTTKQFRKTSSRFEISLVQEAWRQPTLDESRYLNMPEQNYAWIREVMIDGNGQASSYARSIFPQATMQGYWQQFTQLNTRFLGDVLFAPKKVPPTTFPYAQVDKPHGYYRACEYYSNILPAQLWARRSCFWVTTEAWLVDEVFYLH